MIKKRDNLEDIHLNHRFGKRVLFRFCKRNKIHASTHGQTHSFSDIIIVQKGIHEIRFEFNVFTSTHMVINKIKKSFRYIINNYAY